MLDLIRLPLAAVLTGFARWERRLRGIEKSPDIRTQHLFYPIFLCFAIISLEKAEKTRLKGRFLDFYAKLRTERTIKSSNMPKVQRRPLFPMQSIFQQNRFPFTVPCCGATSLFWKEPLRTMQKRFALCVLSPIFIPNTATIFCFLSVFDC